MIQWFIDGRRNYTGPKVDIDESMLTAEENAEIDKQMGGNGQSESDQDAFEKAKRV